LRAAYTELLVQLSVFERTSSTRRRTVLQRPRREISAKAVVTTMIQLQLDCGLTAVRLPFECNSAALQSLYVMSCLFCAAALRPK